jgi:urease accessory protein
LLVINKIDLAPHVGADLDVMRRDSQKMRGERPFMMVSLRQNEGVKQVIGWVREQLASRAASS